jgi:hypothetical protein
MRSLTLLLALLLPLNASGWEASLVHQHYTKWEGVLPEPYNTISFEMRLNPENDDVEFFELKISGNSIDFSEDDLVKLKDIELGTIQFMTEMHRDEARPAEPIYDYFEDWLYITMELGPRYRIDWEEEGKTRYQWGKDKITIMVTMGQKGTISLAKQSPRQW